MVRLIDPANGADLTQDGDRLVSSRGASFPISNGVARFAIPDNYAASFGRQWNAFAETQLDEPEGGRRTSETRFFRTTGWTPDELGGLDVLEVGSGAGRFSRVVLERTMARLWSVDYSRAVDANMRNNGAIAPDRFHLFQASIYELPFPDESFDRAFCMGVLQHTPDFSASVHSLVKKVKKGGEIVVDFYPIKGFWTKLQAKYFLRPITKRMSHDRLIMLIEANVDWMVRLSKILHDVKLGVLTRFLPLCDIKRTMPPDLTATELREWVVLDTFDMFSPQYDSPQRVSDVTRMFEAAGANVTFAGFVNTGTNSAAVVRATRI